jgi:Zn finger protein HypA/HybF involved in hydrogenase expression
VSGTEYRRTVTFACPYCFGVVTREVWVGDLGEVRRMMTRCPVCGSAMLRVDSENEESLVSLLKITCRKIFDAIARQEEEHYARR